MATIIEDSAVHERQWSSRVSAAMLARLAARVAVAAPVGSIPIEAPLHRRSARRGAGRHAGRRGRGRRGRARGAGRRGRSARSRNARPSCCAFHDLFIAHAAEILDVIQLETGKSRHHAFEEVEDIAIQARYYAHSAEDHLSPRRRQGALPLLTRTTEHHRPRGVIGIIAPWNYPLSLSIGDAIPALLAGNAVVLKPDAQTPFTRPVGGGAAGRGRDCRPGCSRWSPVAAPSSARR